MAPWCPNPSSHPFRPLVSLWSIFSPKPPLTSHEAMSIGLQNLELPAAVSLSIRLLTFGDLSSPRNELFAGLDRESFGGHYRGLRPLTVDGTDRNIKFDLSCCPRKECVETRWGRPMRVPRSQASFYYYTIHRLFALKTIVVVLNFSVISRTSIQEMKETWEDRYFHLTQFFSSSERAKPILLLVGSETQLRSDPEIMHKALSTPGEGPILPEEGERVAREIGAARYMECETGNVDHLNAILQETMRLGWNLAQDRMTDTLIYRAEKWLTAKWSTFKGSDR
ncbi:hypothetical protein SISNIDRAFT_484483 [Sistotremastrum niveocremeum HHB9708]|uniref:Uncharacterized protein n=1 Tax=Sistotremastrum niveocremeum HHB9708 TaxID=1314777 RepID=A0A164WDZ5_9AGAM|nr:hypothetical protein SISNIDRAFT_484483 [Sistotremastrum niveocremeum HHB9708]